MIPHIPHHLVVDEILSKLPVKSLIRFKSVCKSWLSTIFSHDFAKLHLKFSSSNPQFLILSNNPSKSKQEVFSVWYDESNCEVIEWRRFVYPKRRGVDSGKCLVRHKGRLKVVDLSGVTGDLRLSSKGVPFGPKYIQFQSIAYVKSLISPHTE